MKYSLLLELQFNCFYYSVYIYAQNINIHSHIHITSFTNNCRSKYLCLAVVQEVMPVMERIRREIKREKEAHTHAHKDGEEKIGFKNVMKNFLWQ